MIINNKYKQYLCNLQYYIEKNKLIMKKQNKILICNIFCIFVTLREIYVSYNCKSY